MPDADGTRVTTFGRSGTSLLISEHHQSATTGEFTVLGDHDHSGDLTAEARIARRFYARLTRLMGLPK